MPKTIIIVGAGISGLSILHYLKKKYAARPDVTVFLLEQSSTPGGTVRSIVQNGCLFEAGPNGFLDSSPREPNGKARTLELIRELDLNAELVRADESAKYRYVAQGGALHAFPMNPAQFLKFPPMGWQEKARVFGEIFIPKGNDPNESVYDFGARRFGKRFADIFLDPMVSGIYGGDAREVVLKSAFGRIYELEQKYGSLFKAMMKLRKGGMPKGRLTSFRQGQAQLITALAGRYAAQIRLGQEVRAVSRNQERYVVYSGDTHYEADEVFVCAPAYRAATILREASPALGHELEKVRYSPMAVVGLVFDCDAFVSPPKGFGYLIPSSEGKEVLGVLFESNLFPGRAPADKILLRVMIGGARHPKVLEKSREELLQLALKEVHATLGAQGNPAETFFVAWPKAIPQYDRTHAETTVHIKEELTKWPGLHLVANYLNGVSLNDCIENAWQAANNSLL